MLLAAAVFPAAPAQAAPKVDCARMKCLALTFDDGPAPATTGKLLTLLKKEKVKATFFVVGKAVEKRPAVLKRTYAEGHEIGNHTYDHPSLPEMMDQEITQQLQITQDAIEGVIGRRPTMFRPPYGHSDDRVLGLAAQEGLAQVKWTATTLDWSLRDTEKITRTVLKLARRNGVILMHDTVPQTVAAMPAVIKELKKRGYQLVTVSQLTAGKPLRAGDKFP
ncbi:polysaccharide deacetylase family protein [Nonomuraea sp. NPDC050556]|uniref:polysaccharide deacetylase family protein n=1 Tax=Nonomuraea sp. NPDC050556 TaxID=3364369 RepID=UPI0037B6779E